MEVNCTFKNLFHGRSHETQRISGVREAANTRD